MKNIEKAWILTVLMAVFYGHATFAGTVPLTMNGVNWNTNYYNPDVLTGGQYDKMPNNATNTSPVWVAEYNTATYTLIDSYLRISSISSNRQSFSTKSNWDLTTNTTVEATLRVIDQTGASGAGSIAYGNSNFYGTVLISTNRIGSSTLHDFTQWTTLRLVFENMHDIALASVKVYINNSPVPAFTNKTWSAGSTVNLLRFGDPNTGSTDGTVDWESIRWTSGAYPPGSRSPVLSLVVLSTP